MTYEDPLPGIRMAFGLKLSLFNVNSTVMLCVFVLKAFK